MRDISKSIPKVDNYEKLSGTAKYVSDYFIDNLYYAKTLRSTKAKAKIKEVIYPDLPDHIFIIDYHDLPLTNEVKMIYDDWKIFADNEVSYIGEPICLVIGQDKKVIQDVLAQIKVEYEDLIPIFDNQKKVIHKSFDKGNIKEAFTHADSLHKETFYTGYQEQAYIEPQGFIGYLEDEKKITLIGSIQCPFYVKNAVMHATGLKDEEVRVIQPAVGGAFGGKEEFPSLMACQLAIAILKHRVPIKMIYEREEDMLVTTKRHPSSITIEAAVKDQKIVGLKSYIEINGGAYIGLSSVVLSRALIAATSAYTIDHLEISGDVYLTNTVPTGAFRGFGAPQMIFAVEMMIEHIANQLKLDSLSFRLKHLAKQNDLTSTSGVFRDPIIMPEMIKKAIEISGYNEKREKYQKGSYKGIGMSWFLHGCGFTGSGEADHIHAKVRLTKDKDNKVYIYCAAADIGQGTLTTLKKIVVHILDIDPSSVVYHLPDTDVVPDSGPTVASRTIMIVGGLLARAAKRLKESWNDSEDIEIIESYVQPDYMRWNEEQLKGDAYPAYSWGVNVVEVEVSPITYQVDIKHVWSVYDIGKAIDERIVLGQTDGGILQGIAYGYLEVMKMIEGKLKHKNLTDYIIPTSLDAAKTETHLFENPFAFGPYGAKGVGELSLVGGAPAVVLAIEMAINRPISIIPATPELIMELINHG